MQEAAREQVTPTDIITYYQYHETGLFFVAGEDVTSSLMRCVCAQRQVSMLEYPPLLLSS